MTPLEYQKLIRRTDYDVHEFHTRFIPRISQPLHAKLIHYSLGLGGESGEILDAVKKVIRDGNPIDRVNLIEEIGDVLWYATNLLTAIDSDLEEAMHANISKLERRYPTGFTEEAGRNRNVNEERNAMEGTINEKNK